jgi:hypothetical protein
MINSGYSSPREEKPARGGLWGKGDLVGWLAPEGQYQHYHHPDDDLHHTGSCI